MRQTIGVLAAEHIAVGLVENSQVKGSIQLFPDADNEYDYFEKMHTEEIIKLIEEQIEVICQNNTIEAIGIGFPGIIRNGVIEDSPNLKQVKGHNLGTALANLLTQKGISAPVHILNDADATAAGIAATRGQLDNLIRVWTLGRGVGFGRYPQTSGIREGGHLVVTLDPKERFCQCGGRGHLEGIMGHRAMRLRFLDLEPEEIFEQANSGDTRCSAFVELWHQALAAAIANSIHMDGPGKFFISGPNAVFIQIGRLHLYLHEMVKMSPLQGSALEVISTNDEIAIIGAAVSAERAASAKW